MADDIVRSLRREPPPFLRVLVASTEALSPRMVRVTLAGDRLAELVVDQPAASVRLLIPSPGSEELVIPEWTGNEFLLPSGDRPAIRTLTPPIRAQGEEDIDLDIVVHDEGSLSEWARHARPGDPAALSGPGRGYEVDTDADAYLLAGDETAIPAIRQLLASLPPSMAVTAHVEIDHPEARLDLPRPEAVAWHVLPEGQPRGHTLAAAVSAAAIGHGTRVWVAGEAAGVQQIRNHLFKQRGIPRAHAAVRGYWKAGRAGT